MLGGRPDVRSASASPSRLGSDASHADQNRTSNLSTLHRGPGQLACAAHLATAPQYQRLRNAYPEAQFPATAGAPPALDVYLIPVRFPDSGATYMPELLEATRELSHALMQDTRVHTAVRRIACIEINLDEHGALTPTVRFVADRS